MTFILPPEEKAAYYDNARQRATLVIKATHDLINAALAQGYQLDKLTEARRKEVGMLARGMKWELTAPDFSQFYAADCFGVGRKIQELLSQAAQPTQ